MYAVCICEACKLLLEDSQDQGHYKIKYKYGDHKQQLIFYSSNRYVRLFGLFGYSMIFLSVRIVI